MWKKSLLRLLCRKRNTSFSTEQHTIYFICDFLSTNFGSYCKFSVSLTHFNMDIGTKIIEVRKQKGLSQTDFAKAVGVSREMIGRYERNEVMPSIEVAKKIANALEVSLDYLAGDAKLAAVDKQTLRLMNDIEELEPAIKDKLFFLANAVIRDACSR
jgi:transcriptional regulator with XRE-family HTH domain